MEEISNKTLATLLVVAIVISLAGTFFAMRGVSQVTTIMTTGAATTTTGEASVNITEQLSIKLVDPYLSVSFGAGYLNSSSSECTLSTNQATRPDCWNLTASGTWPDPSPFRLENDGNVYANVTVEADKSDTTLFPGYTQGTPKIEFNALESGGRVTGCDDTTGNIQSANQSFAAAATKYNVCQNMTYENANDQLDVEFHMTVPTVGSGNYSTTLTFTAATA